MSSQQRHISAYKDTEVWDDNQALQAKAHNDWCNEHPDDDECEQYSSSSYLNEKSHRKISIVERLYALVGITILAILVLFVFPYAVYLCCGVPGILILVLLIVLLFTLLR